MTLLYVPDESIEWSPAELIERAEDGASIIVRLFDINGKVLSSSVKIPNVEISLQNVDREGNAIIDGVDDLTELGHLHEASILYNLRRRHYQFLPYTYVGEIILAVNPYKWLPLYSEELRQKYTAEGARQRGGSGSQDNQLPPHVYSVSTSAYERMAHFEHGKNQSILVSGESGAGKTETTKILMGHMASIATGGAVVSNENETVDAIIKSNPLLESFGNARTLRNDNSSRFGKFVQLQFDMPICTGEFSASSGAEKTRSTLLGAVSKTYLLEKTRILCQQVGERNYHIFYQLLAGIGSNCLKELMLDNCVGGFRYLRQDSRGVIEGVSDENHFKATQEALELVHVTEAEQNAMWKLLSAVLLLGQIKFEPIEGVEAEGGAPAARLHSGGDAAAFLLGLDAKDLEKALTERALVARGETYSVKLSLLASSNCTDALAKHLYTSLFDWLVSRINKSMGASPAVVKRWVGLLDIFGFENFDVNSYEQLMINYANEKLQQKFTADLFSSVQEEYREQGLEWSSIAYQDNTYQVALLEGKGGIIEGMNEEIRTTGQDISFVHKLKSSDVNHHNCIKFPRFSSKIDAGIFTIVHYAGEVTYDAAHGAGFLAKHKDALFPDLKRLLTKSMLPFMQSLFSDESFALYSNGSMGGAPQRRMSALGALSVGSQFKQSLAQLLDMLAASEAHYIRCVKPNTQKLAADRGDGQGIDGDAFHMKMVAEQLRCAGVIEAVRVSRAAYPNRFGLHDFMNRFSFLSTDKRSSTCAASLQQSCEWLLASLSLRRVDQYQVGKTMVYFGRGVLEGLEVKYHARKLHAVVVVQAAVRMFLLRCLYLKYRNAAVKLESVSRQWVVSMWYHKVVHGVILLQTLCRVRAAQKEKLRRLQRRSSVILQAWVRSHLQHRKYAKTRMAIILVQSVQRGKLGRSKYGLALCEKKRQTDAALQVDYLQMLLAEQKLQTDTLRHELDEQMASFKQQSLEAGVRLEQAQKSGDEVDYLRQALMSARLEVQNFNLGLVASSEKQTISPNLGDAHEIVELRILSEHLNEEVKQWREKYTSEQQTCSNLRKKCERLNNTVAMKEAKVLEVTRQMEAIRTRETNTALYSRRSDSFQESGLECEIKKKDIVVMDPAQSLQVDKVTSLVECEEVPSPLSIDTEASQLALCQICRTDEVQQGHQLTCSRCCLLFHTRCVDAEQQTSFSLSGKEREFDFLCGNCNALSPVSKDGTKSRRAKGNAARAQTLKSALKIRKPTIKGFRSTSAPHRTPTAFDIETVSIGAKSGMISDPISTEESMQTREAKKDKQLRELSLQLDELGRKLSEKQHQLEEALEAQRCAEAYADDANCRAEFAAERVRREKDEWVKEQSQLTETYGVMVSAQELVTLRARAENYEYEINQANREIAELRNELHEVDKGGGFFSRVGRRLFETGIKESTSSIQASEPSVQASVIKAEHEAEAVSSAELDYEKLAARLVEKDASRDQLLNKTAEQLHDTMNAKLALELMLEDKDQQLAEKAREVESLRLSLSEVSLPTTSDEGARGKFRSILASLGRNS